MLHPLISKHKNLKNKILCTIPLSCMAMLTEVRIYGLSQAYCQSRELKFYIIRIGIKIRQALRVNNLSSKFGKSPQNVKTKSSNGPWTCWLISISCCVKEKTKWPWKNLRALNFFNTRGPNGPWNCGHIWTPVITSMNCNSFLYLPNFPCHDVKCALSFTYLLRRMITSPVRPHMMAVALVAQW